MPTGSATAVPLILLPGMLSTPRVWEAVVPLLDEGLQVTGYRIDRDDTIGDMADSVLAQAPQRFSLAGHSLGGIVALEIARRAPERLERMVLLNCGARGPAPAQLEAWDELADRTSDGGFQDVLQEQAVINLGAAAQTPAARSAWLADAGTVGADGLLRQLAAQRTRPDSRPTLGAVAVPTLVISGGDDRVCPPELQQELAAGLGRARLVEIEGAGHLSPVDSAGLVAALVNDFLAGR